MTIRYAAQADRAAIAEIWLSAFPADSREDCEAFLDLTDLSSECMVACENGRPISMVFLLPAVLRTEDAEYSLCYVYAAATHADHRGGGVFSKLLREALRLQKEKGIAGSLLSPQSSSLVGFYERFGYVPAIFRRSLHGSAAPIRTALERVSTDEYLAARRSLLPQPHIEWENRFLKSEVSLSVPLRIGSGYALCRQNGSCVHVAECVGVSVTNELCAQLASALECDTYIAHPETSNGDCYGMLLSLAQPLPDCDTVYMGFSFG